MNFVKISVTLHPKVAAELREVAGTKGQSAFVNEAVRQQLQTVRIRQMLRDMEMEAGPVPDDIQRAVDALDWPD